MGRLSIFVLSLLLGASSVLPAVGALDSEPPKDAEFTFARLRFHMSSDSFFQRELPWHHDFPYADEAFVTFLKGATRLHTASNAYQIVDIDSPDLFSLPFVYMSEPGYLDLNPKDVMILREYLERGGFLLVDDFRGERHLSNLVYQLRKVFPKRNIVPLTRDHVIFNSFYGIESLEVRPPYGPGPVEFLGMEDENGRLLMAINYNHDLGEIWQWLDEGNLPLQDAAESLKFGTNYVLYAFTH